MTSAESVYVKQDFFVLTSESKVVLTKRPQLDFFLVSIMGLYAKSRCGTFDSGLE